MKPETFTEQNQELLGTKFFSRLMAISLALGLFCNYLFYKKILGLSFFVFVIAILAAGFWLAKNNRKKISNHILVPAFAMLFFSAMVFVRSSALLTFLNLSVCGFLLLMLIFSFKKPKMTSYLIGDYLAILQVPFRVLRALSIVGPAMTSKLKSKNYKPEITAQILHGLIITLPVLGLFLFLFFLADKIFFAVFVDFIQQALGLVSPEIIIRITHILVITLIFIGIFYYAFQQPSDASQEGETKENISQRTTIELAIFFGSINLLFLFFISVQFKYFFFGAENAALRGFSYAEYARSGFFQLITVAVISFFLIRNLDKKLPQLSKNAGSALLFKILGSALIIQVLIVMVSAFQRLSLYEDAYGFTELRLYSHLFTIFLAANFLWLLYKLLINRAEERFVFGVFINSIAILIALNLLNPDSFIARKNIKRFVSGADLDISYLTSLSDDAIPEIVEILKLPTTGLTPLEEKKLVINKYYIADFLHKKQASFDYNEDWRSLRLSNLTAKKLLALNSVAIEENRIATFLPALTAMPKSIPEFSSEEIEGECYWREDYSGQFKWIHTGYSLQTCFAADSCQGGLGASDGECYKWAKSPHGPGVKWDEIKNKAD